jgi:hypothetical protein
MKLVAERVPQVRWSGDQSYRADPYRSLVDTTKAQRLLGWKPIHTWPGR